MSLRKRSRLKFMPEEPNNGHDAGDALPRPSVGAMLRSERERRGVSIDEAAAQLRIRRVQLDAIEGSRFKELPGAPYAVGFVRAYADFLQLDRDEIVRRFKAESSGLESRKELSFPRPLSESRLPGGVVLLFSAIIAVGAYAVWYFHSTAERAPLPRVAAVPERLAPLADPVPTRAPDSPVAASTSEPSVEVAASEPAQESASPAPAEPVATASPVVPASPPHEPATPPGTQPEGSAVPPAPAVIVAESPSAPAAVSAAPAASPAPPAATAAAPSPPPPAALPARTESPPPPPSDTPPLPRVYGDTTGQSRIVLRASADSWIQVRDGSGNIVFARVLRPGDMYKVPNRRGLLLHTGNAGVLEVHVDGQAAPPIGKVGVVKREIALDPERLIAGNADQSRPSAGEPAPPSALPRSGAQGG